ncbi:MAG TPA: transglycosylase SLT domain-containing protein [Candidatus Angelobacter sp.]|nr:transglycosylase SLT domain-containing protein [Candidatus Angelobacter sp.]
MKLSRSIGVGLVLLTAQLTALSAEVAVLRNGFTIRCERKKQTGSITRLYTRGGFVDVPTAEIASFEPDDTPDPESAPPDTPSPAAAQPAVSLAVNPGLVPNSSAPPSGTAIGTPQKPVASPPTRAGLDQMVREASSRHQIDPDFVNSVIKAESNFQPRAVSRKGAQGLMQLMPTTASHLGVNDPFDPQANVEGGTSYLSQLLDQYHDDPIKALAAYNAGPQRVDQYHGVPPYLETRAYVARIVRDYNAKKRAQMKAQLSSASKSSTSEKNTKKKSPPATPQPPEAGVARVKKPA